MRYVAAVLAFILGGVALFVGIAQQTIWAPSQTATATITQSLDKAPVTLIRPDVQAISKEPVDFTITSDAPFVAALGRTGDVDAWVKGSAYNELTKIEEREDENSIVAAHHDGATSVPNPAASDLWVAQQESQGQMVHRWTVPDDGPWTLLLASKDGKSAAPTDIQVSWSDPQNTPWAVPLIVIGSILLLIGLGLLGWAISKARAVKSGATSSKSVLKRTPAKVAASSSAAVAIFALAVSGAIPAHANSAAPSSSEASEGSSNAQYPVVLPNQLDTILEKIATTVNDADKTGDLTKVKSRIDGAALSLRTNAYSLAKRDYEFEKPFSIVAGPVRSSAVTTQATFPRRLMVVTQENNTALPQILTIEQKTARSQYKLVNAVSMLPGEEFPGIAFGDSAVRPLALSATGFKRTPQQAVNDLSTYLGGGRDRNLFEKSAFIDETRKVQADLKKQGDDARFYFRRLWNPKRTFAFSTPDGGALVTAYYQNQTKVRPKSEGGTITLDSSTARMAGTKTTNRGVNIKYVEPVVIYIPPADSSEKISLIGANVLQYEAEIVSRTAPID